MFIELTSAMAKTDQDEQRQKECRESFSSKMGWLCDDQFSAERALLMIFEVVDREIGSMDAGLVAVVVCVRGTKQKHELRLAQAHGGSRRCGRREAVTGREGMLSNRCSDATACEGGGVMDERKVRVSCGRNRD